MEINEGLEINVFYSVVFVANKKNKARKSL